MVEASKKFRTLVVKNECLSACRCTFMRTEDHLREHGIAITTSYGLSNVVVIIPDNATSATDVVQEVYNYWLDWTCAMNADNYLAEDVTNEEV